MGTKTLFWVRPSRAETSFGKSGHSAVAGAFVALSAQMLLGCGGGGGAAKTSTTNATIETRTSDPTDAKLSAQVSSDGKVLRAEITRTNLCTEEQVRIIESKAGTEVEPIADSKKTIECGSAPAPGSAVILFQGEEELNLGNANDKGVFEVKWAKIKDKLSAPQGELRSRLNGKVVTIASVDLSPGMAAAAEDAWRTASAEKTSAAIQQFQENYPSHRAEEAKTRWRELRVSELKIEFDAAVQAGNTDAAGKLLAEWKGLAPETAETTQAAARLKAMSREGQLQTTWERFDELSGTDFVDDAGFAARDELRALLERLESLQADPARLAKATTKAKDKSGAFHKAQLARVKSLSNSGEVEAAAAVLQKLSAVEPKLDGLDEVTKSYEKAKDAADRKAAKAAAAEAKRQAEEEKRLAREAEKERKRQEAEERKLAREERKRQEREEAAARAAEKKAEQERKRQEREEARAAAKAERERKKAEAAAARAAAKAERDRKRAEAAAAKREEAERKRAEREAAAAAAAEAKLAAQRKGQRSLSYVVDDKYKKTNIVPRMVGRLSGCRSKMGGKRVRRNGAKTGPLILQTWADVTCKGYTLKLSKSEEQLEMTCDNRTCGECKELAATMMEPFQGKQFPGTKIQNSCK